MFNVSVLIACILSSVFGFISLIIWFLYQYYKKTGENIPKTESNRELLNDELTNDVNDNTPGNKLNENNIEDIQMQAMMSTSSLL